MYVAGKSDRPVVPAKPSNKATAEAVGAEMVEERGRAKGNTTGETHPGRCAGFDVSSGLDRVREVAKRDRDARFTSLMHHVTPDRLLAAYWDISPEAAAGVDGVTWREYGGSGLYDRILDLHGRVRSNRYRAKPSRRTYIPKPDGRLRPLGIASLEDKIVQRAVVEVLNAVYEVDFRNFSYGFRPGRGPHDALDALQDGIMSRRVNWVLDADISNFFGQIDHKWLREFFEHRIKDPGMWRLIGKWLAAGVIENDSWERLEVGTPQGASASPLIANAYLHYVFDLWVDHWRRHQARGDVIVVRFADDFIVGFQYENDARRFLGELHERMARFGLSLHPDKTRLIEFGRYAIGSRRNKGLGKPETFDFLGFTHICAMSQKGRFWVRRITIAKRLRAKLAQVRVEIRKRMHLRVSEQGRWLAQVLNGYMGYYSVPGNGRAMSGFRYQVTLLWRKALGRRSQKGRITWARMSEVVARWLPRVEVKRPYRRRTLAL